MFYESDKIDKKFICPVCNHRFDVPKSLPCGESICERCVSMCIKKAQTPKNDYKAESIDCPLCDEMHAIPKKGFPTQKLLQELLDLQPTKVFRGALFEKLETGLQTLNTELDVFKDYIDESDSKIKNHCDFIREDIDIYTESLIDDLHKLRMKLLGEVDTFEKKSQEGLCRNKNDMYSLLNDIRESHTGYQAQARHADLDKDVLKNLVNETNAQVGKIQKSKEDFEALLQKGRLICFRPSRFKFKESYIGQMSYNGVDGELEEDEIEASEYEDADEKKKDDVWSEIEDNENGDTAATMTTRVHVPKPAAYKIRKIKIKKQQHNSDCNTQ